MTLDKALRTRLELVLGQREHEIPHGMGFEGTGSPGLYLEHLLGLRTSNQDIPDARAWEIKYSSGNSLVTLFHKDPYPRGKAIRYMINQWGWTGRNGLQSFRHTICSESERFLVVDEANEIKIRRTGHDDLVPHWPHDTLVNSLSRKLRNLVVVHGRKRGRTVWYESAEILTEVRSSRFIRAILQGVVCIDFDAYIRENGSIRNHGTKFRVKTEDLHRIYTGRRHIKMH